MKLRFILLCLILSFGFALPANAQEALTDLETSEQCDKNIVDAVGNHFKLKNFWKPEYYGSQEGRSASETADGVIVAQSCKVWPHNTNMVLTVFAYTPAVGSREYDYDEYDHTQYNKDLIVAMVDKRAMQVVSSYQSIIYEDAFITKVDSTSFSFDTAPYQLTPDVRAFGLRFNSSARGASCGESRRNDQLTLFVPEGKQLRPVLGKYMYRQEALQGCIGIFEEGAVWENATLTISIAKTRTHGYADLLVTATIEHYSNAGATLDEKASRVEHYLLRYDGKGYSMGKDAPWWMGDYSVPAIRTNG